jgi:hypothetical protein
MWLADENNDCERMWVQMSLSYVKAIADICFGDTQKQ